MKNEKGITLIALVITIIVMLILVVVTVTIALDGGLFTKSKDAADATNKEAEREELTSIVLGTYDGVTATVDLTTIQGSLTDTEKWSVEEPAEGKLKVTGVKSETIWTIDESGTISDNSNN